MKIIGCAAILLSFTAAGMYASMQLEKRIRQLKNMEKAVLSMTREIDYQLAPLSEALLHTAKRTESPWNLFFQEAGQRFQEKAAGLCCPDEIFQEAIIKMRRFHPWDKDLNILLSLGRGLGELDKKMQIMQLHMAEEEIRQAVKMAQEEQLQKGKLYQTLGVCMGILGVILML